MSKFSNYEYRKQPGFDMNTFEGANQAIPMKTLVIYCFDPRAAEIPHAVARYFGNEVCRVFPTPTQSSRAAYW